MQVRAKAVHPRPRWLSYAVLLLTVSGCSQPDVPSFYNGEKEAQTALLAAAPVDLTVDTDIEVDVDDVGALAVAHALADNGEVNVLAVMVDTASPWGPSATDVINTYYGRPDVSVGHFKGSNFPGTPTGAPGNYTQYLTQNYPNDLGSGSNAPNAVALYRQILASRPDNSVTIAAIGFLNNLSELMDSTKLDGYSDLTGMELIRRKVKLLTVQGGEFPKPDGRDDFNWGFNKPAAAHVINHWPGRIIFGSYGPKLGTGPRLTRETPPENPVRKAYEIFPGVMNTRPSWDQVVVLAARQALTPYFTEGGTDGSVSYNVNTGEYTFSSEDKAHSWLVQAVSDASLTTMIEDLMVQSPALRPVADGVYRLVAKASGKVLDLKDASRADGERVWQFPWLAGENQRWQVESVGGGYYRLVAQHSGKVLDVANCSTADQARVQQFAWLNNDCQKWRIEGAGGGTYRLVNKSSNKVLDLSACSVADGATVWQFTWLDNDCQRWRLQPVSPNSVPNGTYRLTNKNSGKVADVRDASTADGAALWQFSWLGGDNQKWRFEPVEDGFYRIVAEHSRKVLDVQSFSSDDAAPVAQFSWLGGENQKWGVEALGGGDYRILAKHSGKVLDVSNAATADQAPLWQHRWLSADNQKWRLDRLGP